MEQLTTYLDSLQLPELSHAHRLQLVEVAEKALGDMALDDAWTFSPKEFKTNAFIVLAANCLQLAVAAEGPLKDRFFQKMRNFLGKSDRIEINERRSFVLKGFYCLFMNDLKQASDYFENAKDQGELSLSCLVGRGMLEFHKQNFSEALFYWKTAFRAFRKDLPELAYLLGIAYFRLGKNELAEKAFAYLLRYQNGKAMAGSGVCALLALYLRTKRVDEFYDLLSRSLVAQTQELQSTKEQVQAETAKLSSDVSAGSPLLRFPPSTVTDPNLTLLLAEHYFFKGEASKAVRMCSITLGLLSFWPSDKNPKGNESKSHHMEIKARIAYIQGFLEHQKGTSEGMDKAYKLYSTAVQSFPQHLPAQFGLAQIYLFQKNYSEALNCLELVLRSAGDTDAQEAIRLLPLLYSRTGQRDKAIACFEKALQFAPKNVDLLIDYANFLDGVDSKSALRVYERVLQVLGPESQTQPWRGEVLNNFGVSLAKERHFARAQTMFEEAKRFVRDAPASEEESLTPEDQLRAQASLFIIEFNIGSLKAKRGAFLEAKKTLEALCQSFRGNYEAHLSLTNVLYKLGDLEGSRKSMEKAIAVCSRLQRLSRAEEALCLKANLLIEQKDFQKAFSFLQRFRGTDPYYLLTKIRILYAYIIANRENPQELRKLVREGAEAYSLVAGKKEEEGNMFAALSAAILLLERGRLSDAAEVFQHFQAALRENSPLVHNQSIVDFISGDLDKVILRQETLREKTPRFLKAVYGLAYTLREDWRKAERIWKYRLLREPSLRNYFNFAAFLDERLKSIVKTKLRSLEEMEESLEGGWLAKRIFQRVYSLIPDKVALCLNPELNWGEINRQRLAQLRSKAEHHLFFIEQNFEGYQQRVEKERQKAHDQVASVQSRKYLIIKQREDAGLLEEEKLKKAQREREELERRAREAEEKAREFTERFALAQKTENQPKPKTPRKSSRVPTDTAERPKKQPKKAKRAGKRSKRQEEEEESESSEDELSESNDFIAKDDESLDFERRSIESEEPEDSGEKGGDENFLLEKRNSVPVKDGVTREPKQLKKIKRSAVAKPSKEKPPREESPVSEEEELPAKTTKPKVALETGTSKKKRVFLDESDDN